MIKERIKSQKMKVGNDLFLAFLDGNDIVLHAFYANAFTSEIRISGSRITKMLELEHKQAVESLKKND